MRRRNDEGGINDAPHMPTIEYVSFFLSFHIFLVYFIWAMFTYYVPTFFITI